MSLYQYFLAIDDVESLNGLLHTLSVQVEDALDNTVLNLVRSGNVLNGGFFL